ncbi:MAG: chemotaxis protein CheB, partial [Thermoplasmatota archaeon]
MTSEGETPAAASDDKTVDAHDASESVAPAAADPAAGAPFPIVGVGASAGGFEAFAELVRGLPSKPGLAVVLVQHLDPTHEGHLVRLIGRETRLAVLEATDGMRVEPDHVYVIAPGAILALRGGVLRVTPRGVDPGHHNVIDRFFRSLAEDRQQAAIGVVLSGTLSDGAQGLREIKSVGGFTFAQTPESAKYREMPRNAIATGVVDFVLDPPAIARELTKIGAHVTLAPEDDVGGPATMGLGGEKDFADILRFLRLRKNVDFTRYKRATILRRMQRRMIASHKETLREYAMLLKEDPREIDALFDDVLIHVTRFFREEDAFAALRDVVFPAIVANRPPGRAIRVWVPGCSTGEEAYSVAIALTEFLHDNGLDYPIQIFATDVSEKAIRAAREGIYSEAIADDVSKTRLLRFFQKINGHWQINRTIRAACVFATQDVTRDPPFSSLDVVHLCNVLIYLEPALQGEVLRTMHYALRPDGFLVLGASESPGRAAEYYSTVDVSRRVFRKRAMAPSPIYDFGHFRRAAERTRAEPGARASPSSDEEIRHEVDRLLASRGATPSLVLDGAGAIVEMADRPNPFTERVGAAVGQHVTRVFARDLADALQDALDDAKREGRTISREEVRFISGDGARNASF